MIIGPLCHNLFKLYSENSFQTKYEHSGPIINGFYVKVAGGVRPDLARREGQQGGASEFAGFGHPSLSKNGITLNRVCSRTRTPARLSLSEDSF